MRMDDLSSVLWRERDLLDLLLFRIEVEQLVLADGRAHWLPLAAREIEGALEEIRRMELLRAVHVDALAADLGLPPDASLSEIAESSREPWRAILLDHRDAFRTVAAQVSQLTQSNQVLLTAGYQAAQAALLPLIAPHRPPRDL